MKTPKGFIELCAQYDNKPLIVRTDLIESVSDNAEDKDGETIRLACRTVNYAGRSVNVTDSFDDILDKMYF